MKKAISLLVLSAVTATSLIACGKPSPKTVEIHSPAPSQSTKSAQQATEPDIAPDINIKIDGKDLDAFLGERMHFSPISGVRRHLCCDLTGSYTIEYVHAPYDSPKDDTLSYNLVLNADNTFTLDATSDGVTANHYGHWYSRHNSITLFYDEPIDPTAHNVYVSDSLYAERLDQGKLLIYDNCNTIILSKEPTVSPSEPNA